MQKAPIILDRDGVINRDTGGFIYQLSQFQLLPGSVEAIVRLCQAGYQVTMATNQSGVARHYISPTALSQIHHYLESVLREAGGHLDYIAVCPHGPDDGCDCRKPKPGLLWQIRDALHLSDLKEAWLIGDSLRDLQAGEAAGTHVGVVRTGNGPTSIQALKNLALGQQVRVFDDLADFVNQLLAEPSAPAQSLGQPIETTVPS